MHKSFLCSGLLAALTIANVQAAPLEVNGSGLVQNLPCTGQDVSISGNDNQIHLSGQCASVLVQGWNLQVTLNKADSLRVNGANNQVRVERTDSLSVDGSGNRIRATLSGGEPPSLASVAGAEHLLDLHFNGPARVELGGMDHRLDWHGHEPVIEASGVRHQISRW